MALRARRWPPGREVALPGDGSFAALDLLVAPARRPDLIGITRPRLDAAPCEGPAPPRRPGTVGRPRTKGARPPNLADILAERGTRWMRVTVAGWYGGGERVVEIRPATAVRRHAGLPVLPIRPSPTSCRRSLWDRIDAVHRWVPLRDPRQRFAPQALLRTEPACDPLQVVRWFVRRGQVEVTFREVRAHLGVETQRRWSERALARTTPCLLAPFSIATLLAARLGRRARSAAAPARPFAPMLGTANRGQPSPTPLPLSAGSSGASQVCSRRGGRPRRANPAPRPAKASSMRSAKLPNGQSRTHGQIMF
jgi:hypothetical protein